MKQVVRVSDVLASLPKLGNHVRVVSPVVGTRVGVVTEVFPGVVSDSGKSALFRFRPDGETATTTIGLYSNTTFEILPKPVRVRASITEAENASLVRIRDSLDKSWATGFTQRDRLNLLSALNKLGL